MSNPAPPKTIHEAIKLAISDGRKLDPEIYFPHHNVYHVPADEIDEDFEDPDTVENLDKCRVCDAGAVMVGTLKVDFDNYTTPASFETDWKYVLESIDFVRFGDYGYAYEYFYKKYIQPETRKQLQNIPIPRNIKFIGFEQYHDHLDSLVDIANEFERLGL